MLARTAIALLCVGGSSSIRFARPGMPANELIESEVPVRKLVEKPTTTPDLPSILRAHPNGHEGPKAPALVPWLKTPINEFPATTEKGFDRAQFEAILKSSTAIVRSI